MMEIQAFHRIRCECGYTEDVPITDKMMRDVEGRAAYVAHLPTCAKYGPLFAKAKALAIEFDQAMADLGWFSTALAYGAHGYLGIEENVPEGLGA